MKGEITSLITPWPKVNNYGVDGLEWGSAVAFCSRPGCGKTVLLDQLCREVYKLNPNTKMRILKFELEMLAQVTAIREFSSILSKSYAYICSAEEEILIDDAGQATGHKRKLSKEELIKCWEYVQRKTVKDEQTKEQKFPEDIIEKSPTVKEFEQIVHQYMQAYKITKKEMVDGKEIDIDVFTNTLIGIDHLRLLRCEEKESEQQMLYNACITINRLKRQYNYPIIFVALNHVLRDVNSDARTENGKHSNYLRDSDIFGADAIVQNFDMVIIMDRPSLRNITRYGPSYYIIDDTPEGKSTLVFQFVKVRNGIPGMSFFRGQFDKMKIIEIEPPAKAAAQKQNNYNQKIESNEPFKNNQTKAKL